MKQYIYIYIEYHEWTVITTILSIVATLTISVCIARHIIHIVGSVNNTETKRRKNTDTMNTHPNVLSSIQSHPTSSWEIHPDTRTDDILRLL